MNLDQVGNTRQNLLNNIERYKNYIITLTEQTQKLSDELERIVQEDEKMYNIVDRAPRLCAFVEENKKILNDEMEAMTDYRTNQNNFRSTSPNRGYYQTYERYGC